MVKQEHAENPHGDDHSIFIAVFAPRENPQIALAVYVENAGLGIFLRFTYRRFDD